MNAAEPERILLVCGEISEGLVLRAVEALSGQGRELYALAEMRMVPRLRACPEVHEVIPYDFQAVSLGKLLKKLAYEVAHRLRLAGPRRLWGPPTSPGPARRRGLAVVVPTRANAGGTSANGTAPRSAEGQGFPAAAPRPGEETMRRPWTPFQRMRQLRFARTVVVAYRHPSVQAVAFTALKYEMLALASRARQRLGFDGGGFYLFPYGLFWARFAALVALTLLGTAGFSLLLLLTLPLLGLRALWLLAHGCLDAEAWAALRSLGRSLALHARLTLGHNPVFLGQDLRLLVAELAAFLLSWGAPVGPGGPIREILVIRIDQIGDMVHLVPALKTLRQQAPQARITLVVCGGGRQAIEGCPLVDEILIYRTGNPRFNRDGRGPGPWAAWRFLRELRRRRYDLALDPTGEMDSLRLLLLCQARVKVAMGHRNRRHLHGVRLYRHFAHLVELERILGMLRRAGLRMAEADRRLEVWLSRAERAQARQARQRLLSGLPEETLVVGIHAGGAWAPRLWPVERFGAVAARLLRRVGSVAILFFAGPGEEALAEEFRAAVADASGPSATGRVVVLQGQSFREFLALWGACDLLLCNDSGPMHLGFALGRPVVALFGPGNYTQWVPRDRRATALRVPVACSPCAQLHCEDNVCLQRLSVETVAARVEAEVEGIRTRRQRERMEVRHG